jgi:hypothetical protein
MTVWSYECDFLFCPVKGVVPAQPLLDDRRRFLTSFFNGGPNEAITLLASTAFVVKFFN